VPQFSPAKQYVDQRSGPPGRGARGFLCAQATPVDTLTTWKSVVPGG